MPTVRIEPNYKVSIPKDTRESLGLKVGDEVQITLRPAKTPATYTPTARERRAIEKGREEIRRGEYLTLDEFFKYLDVERHPAKARPKNGKARASRRTRATTHRS